MTVRGIVSVLFCLFLIAGCSNDAKEAEHRDAAGQKAAGVQRPTASAGGVADATTQPAGVAGGDELLAQSSSFEGFGAEAYRLVDQRDQIVSVLKNGMTVIVQRMATPVVSVRGVTMAGGVYEGKWLGGGLSHLLEHLVAGCSNKRRTDAQNRALLQQ